MESMHLFIVASLALIITPGPDLVYVLARGMAGGKRAGVISAFGVTSGIFIHTVAAAFGLAMLLQASPAVFNMLKIIGGGYLLFLGWKMVKDTSAFNLSVNTAPYTHQKLFTQGFLSNVLNPKLMLFFVAFLPQFIPQSAPDKSFQMIIYGGIFALLTVMFLCSLGICAGSISSWLKERQRVASNIRVGSGLILALLGLRLIFV